MRIRIIKTPPGSVAPESIREQWVGVEMPIVEGENQDSDRWVGQANTGGYVVNIKDAIQALRAVGKDDAAEFWESIESSLGERLRFKTECCEVI